MIIAAHWKQKQSSQDRSKEERKETGKSDNNPPIIKRYLLYIVQYIIECNAAMQPKKKNPNPSKADFRHTNH